MNSLTSFDMGFFQSKVPVYVNRLNSVETIVPYEYHK